MNDYDGSDAQRESDEADFDAWLDSHAPEHYEPNNSYNEQLESKL